MKRIALVLSGGGGKGIFQSTLIKNIVDKYNVEFSYISGVSVGALNASLIASNKINELVKIWDNLSDSDVYEKRGNFRLLWNFGMHKLGVSNPLKGAYSNEPLYKLIQKSVQFDEIQVPLEIGRVEFSKMEYISKITKKNFHKEILASTAIPVVWSPVEIDGKLYVDGGVKTITPIGDVLKYDPDLIIAITTDPFNEHTIEIDGKEIYELDKPEDEKGKDIFEIAYRTLEGLIENIFINDIDKFLTYNHFIKQVSGDAYDRRDGRILKYYDNIIIHPSNSLGDGLDFSNKSKRLRKNHAHQVFDEMVEKGLFSALE